MASEVIRARQRMVILKLTLDIISTSSRTYINDENYSSNSDLVLMCMALALGQMEGRPMSALKLSQFIGMPRGTVVRKLRELMARGLVETPSLNRYALPVSRINSEVILRSVARLERSIHAASTALSKLDK